MTYSIELTHDDLAFIKASVLMNTRIMQEKLSVDEAVKFTNAAAQAVTKLNEARMSTVEVMFLNTCLQKTKDALRRDRFLSKSERELAIKKAEDIIDKLAGIDRPRAVIHAHDIDSDALN